MIPAALAEQVRAAAREAPGGVAAFDADGTLWRDDVGEAFLRHLIGLGWVTLPGALDPWQAYEREVERDRATGYAFAARLFSGLEAARVEAEALLFAQGWVPSRLIADARALRELCEREGLQTIIVSASPLPIVRAAGPLAGFAVARCRGIETVVDLRTGRLSDEVVLPITYAEGKVAAAARFGRLAVACGDSLHGDLALLSAARVAAVVAPVHGSPLADEARRRGWTALDAGS